MGREFLSPYFFSLPKSIKQKEKKTYIAKLAKLAITLLNMKG